MMAVRRAVHVLRSGGVVAYPTEGVFGLGCLPSDSLAIRRLLNIKHRDPAKGLILIAADTDHLEDWIDLPRGTGLPAPAADRPTTWIVPARSCVSRLVRGVHESVAVRLTTNPIAHALCKALSAPLVSTSANTSGRPVARNRFLLQQQFGALVDYIVPGACGPASGPSEIRVFETGLVLRPKTN